MKSNNREVQLKELLAEHLLHQQIDEQEMIDEELRAMYNFDMNDEFSHEAINQMIA